MIFIVGGHKTKLERHSKIVEKINAHSFYSRVYENAAGLYVQMNSIFKPNKHINTDTFCFFFYLRAKSQNEIYSTCCHRWTNFAARSPSHACKSPLLLQKDTERSQLSQSSRRSSWPDKDWCKHPRSLLGWEGMWDDLLLQLQWIALLPKVRKCNHKTYCCEVYVQRLFKTPS